MPFAYPLFLSLEGEHCLVVGLGEVGRRKLAGLLAAGVGSVLALDMAPAAEQDPARERLLADPRVRFERRVCTPADIAPCRLVFAATGEPGENARIAALCREAGVLCNCASAPAQGQFAVPAVARSGELCAALSTGGASPALARRLRGQQELWLEPRAALTHFLGRLRPLVLAMQLDTGQNSQLFRKVASSPLGEWLCAGDLASCRSWIERELRPPLASRVLEILEGEEPLKSAGPVADGETHECC